jgi:hypothetical protein
MLDLPPARVVIEGSGEPAEELLRQASRLWHPVLYVFRGTPPEPFSLPGELGAGPARKEARALVCFGTRCLAPITAPGDLAPAIAGATS